MAVHRVPTSAILVVIASLLIPCRVHGADDGEQPLSADRVQSLVDRLDSNALAARVEAERSLQELGPAVLPHLPNPDTLSASAAEAVKRIRRRLEQQQAQSALQPTRVTLSGRRPLAEVLAAIASQTGNSLNVARLPAPLAERPLAVDFEQRPFWQAIRTLEEQAGITVRPGDDPRTLDVTIRTDAEPLTPAYAVDGLFRLDAVSATVRPDFINPERRILRLTLELFTEPRLRPLFVHVADDNLTVNDAALVPDGGLPLVYPPLSPEASREIPVDKPGPVRIRHDVVLPRENAADVLRSVSMKGTIDVEVAATEQRFEFRHLTEPGPITRRHGGVSVTLDDVRHEDTDLHASIRIAYDAGGPRFESHRAWVFHNAVWLTTPNGNESIRPAEFDTILEGEGGATLRYRFADVAAVSDETQLIYVAPTLVSRVPVEFSLQDIPVEE